MKGVVRCGSRWIQGCVRHDHSRNSAVSSINPWEEHAYCTGKQYDCIPLTRKFRQVITVVTFNHKLLLCAPQRFVCYCLFMCPPTIGRGFAGSHLALFGTGRVYQAGGSIVSPSGRQRLRNQRYSFDHELSGQCCRRLSPSV